LRYIGILATGHDMVDLKAARAKGVTVTNVPGYGAAAVGQQAMALLLEICNNVGAYSQAVRQGDWVGSRLWSHRDRPLIELAGLTMGVIGLGRIGLSVARTAAAMGMRILADGRHPTAKPGEPAEYVSLEGLLAGSDVIVLCCPLDGSTRGMIGEAAIDAMKEGVIIVNVSRGPLIDEERLAAALESGKVLAAGLDVVSREPIRPDNPLMRAKNCFITPHLAGSSRGSRGRLLSGAIENLRMFLSGTPVNVVNP
jgi:glycerate dehydrogenase